MISAMADGELSGGEAERLQRHIDGCPSCASRLELYKLMSEAVSQDEAEAPGELRVRVLERIASMPVPRAGAAPETVSADPALPRPVWTRRARAPAPARRRGNLRRLLPVACLVVLLFAIRTSRMAEYNRRELEMMTGGGAYLGSSDYTPEIRDYNYDVGSGGDGVTADADFPAGEDAPAAKESVYTSNQTSEAESASAAPAAAPEEPSAIPIPSLDASVSESLSEKEPSSAQRQETGASSRPTDDMTRYDTPGDDSEIYSLPPAPSGYNPDELYAFVWITGELPETLLGKSLDDLGNGEYSIRVTRAEADKLIGLGYEAQLTGLDLPEAVVIYKR
jgi:hypothetical protein